MPTRLWSAVVSQLPMPVLADGRRMMPPSATAVAISSPSYPGASSRILPFLSGPPRGPGSFFIRALEGAALGLVRQPSAQRLQVGDQGRDLVVGEAQVGHDRSRLLLRWVGEPQAQVL